MSLRGMSKADSPAIMPLAQGTLVKIIAAQIVGVLMFEVGLFFLALLLGAHFGLIPEGISGASPLAWAMFVLIGGGGLFLIIWGIRKAFQSTGWTALIFELSGGVSMLVNFVFIHHLFLLIFGIIAVVFGVKTYKANMQLISLSGGAIGPRSAKSGT